MPFASIRNTWHVSVFAFGYTIMEKCSPSMRPSHLPVKCHDALGTAKTPTRKIVDPSASIITSSHERGETASPPKPRPWAHSSASRTCNPSPWSPSEAQNTVLQVSNISQPTTLAMAGSRLPRNGQDIPRSAPHFSRWLTPSLL